MADEVKTGIDVMSDSTGRAIVAAIQGTDVVKSRKAEIDQYAAAAMESITEKGTEVKGSIPSDYSALVDRVAALENKAISGTIIETVDEITITE